MHNNKTITSYIEVENHHKFRDESIEPQINQNPKVEENLEP